LGYNNILTDEQLSHLVYGVFNQFDNSSVNTAVKQTYWMSVLQVLLSELTE